MRRRSVDRPGLSWGSTLDWPTPNGIPNRVNALVLGFVTTTSRREIEWITVGIGRVFEQWEAISPSTPHRDNSGISRPVEADARTLVDPDPLSIISPPEWCTWEDADILLDPRSRSKSSLRGPACSDGGRRP